MKLEAALEGRRVVRVVPGVMEKVGLTYRLRNIASSACEHEGKPYTPTAVGREWLCSVGGGDDHRR